MALQHIYVSTAARSTASRFTSIVLAAVVGVELAIIMCVVTMTPLAELLTRPAHAAAAVVEHLAAAPQLHSMHGIEIVGGIAIAGVGLMLITLLVRAFRQPR